MVLGDELVEFVHKDDAGHAAGVRVAEFALEEVERVGGTDAVTAQGFPEEGVGLVGVGYFHAVDLDEDEVVEFVGENG